MGGFRFPGPGETVYTVAFYPGCSYCHHGPGWSIQKWDSDEDRRTFDVDSDPELQFADHGEAALWVVEPEDLRDALAAEIGDLPEIEDSGLVDDVNRAVHDAAWKTFGRWKKVWAASEREG